MMQFDKKKPIYKKMPHTEKRYIVTGNKKESNGSPGKKRREKHNP